MKSPIDSIRPTYMELTSDTYWDFVFLCCWIFVIVLIIAAIMSHIRTEEDIANEQRKLLEEAKKKGKQNGTT